MATSIAVPAAGLPVAPCCSISARRMSPSSLSVPCSISAQRICPSSLSAFPSISVSFLAANGVAIRTQAPSRLPLHVDFVSYEMRHERTVPAHSPGKRRLVIGATAAEAPPLPLPKQKIRIKLRSYWTPLIEQASKQILDAAKNTNAKFMGPVPLPTKRRIYCVLRSPHVNKDSREHFEIRTHRRLIDIDNPTAQTIDALMQLDIPAGVDVEVKL